MNICPKNSNSEIVLSNEQKEILKWLFHHTGHTALDTWLMLFGERNNKYPDHCIKLYDELPIKEKQELEFVFAKYYYLIQHKTRTFSELINDINKQ